MFQRIKKKQTSEISLEGLHFDSSEYQIGELESQERISSNQEAVREKTNGRGDEKLKGGFFCGVELGMIRASGKFGSDNGNNLHSFFLDMNQKLYQEIKCP